MVRPARIRAKTNWIGFTNQIGTNCIDCACFDGGGWVKHKHFTFDDIREIGLSEIAVAEP